MSDPEVEDTALPANPGSMSLTSDEVNYLIFRYLQESGFVHSAFSFAHESMLSRTGLRAVDRNLPPGALISFIQKGLQYIGIEETLLQQQQHLEEGAGDPNVSEVTDFTLLSPCTLSALARPNPPILLNVPPAAAAAAIKARLEAEARQQQTPLAMAQQQENASLARQALAAQATAAHQLAALQQQQQQQQHEQQRIVQAASNHSSYADLQSTIASSQQQRALDLLTLQQQQPPMSAHLLGVSLAAAVSNNSSSNSNAFKRTVSGGKRGPKKQKKSKGDLLRRTSLGQSSAKSEPDEDDDEVETGAANTNTSSSLTGPQRETTSDATAMDVDEDNNDEPPRQRETVPAHKGQHQASPLPSASSSSNSNSMVGLPNGDHDRQHQQASDVIGHSNGTDGESPAVAAVSSGGAGSVEAEPEDRLTAALSKEVLLLQMHESEVFMCAWNPIYTSLIATGSGDASARIWEMTGGDAEAGLKSVKLLPHGLDARDKKNKDVTTLEWSLNGLYLATGSYDGIARVWARNGALLYTLRKHTGPIFSLKWNKQGNYLLSGSYDTTAIVWDVSEPKADPVVQQFTDHEAPALDVDWKDDLTFATCSTDKTVHIYRVGIPRPLKVYRGHTDEVNAVKWDPSGTFLASCSDDCTAKVWEVNTERSQPLYDFTSHRQEIYTVKWSPTGPGSRNPTKRPLLATASFDGTVRLWNVTDGSCFAVFSRHRDSVYSVAFAPSGDYLASGSLAGQMYIWDIVKGEPVKSYKGKGDIFEVAWNKEETRVAACFSSNVVAVIDFNIPPLQ